jgi:hypothetical protein
VTEGVEANSLEAKLKQKLAERAVRLGVTSQSTISATAPQPLPFLQDVPEIGAKHTDPAQEELDRAIENLGIIEAYNRWANKTKVGPTNKKDGIKVSCPNPAHPDKNPSAWLNTEKNTYYCGGCAEGGDIWDIAAYRFGFDVPSYKATDTFKELKIKIAEDLGFQISSGPGWMNVIPPGASAITLAPSGSITPAASGSTSSPEQTSSTTETEETSKPAANNAGTPPSSEPRQEDPSDSRLIPWREIVPVNTFLWDWLTATTVDDCAEEFHFWTGLVALGLATGRQVMLRDVPAVSSNLYICLMGPSGSKKSQAKRHLKDTILEILPYDHENPFSFGTKVIGGAGSGEYLLDNFSRAIEDPAGGKKPLGYAPVRGLIEYEELAALMAAASRQSSTLRTNLMDIYDAPKLLTSGSKTHGKTTADNPYGSAFSTTQNASLSGLMSKGDDGSGFVNRWVFVSGIPKRVTSWGKIEVDLKRAHNALRTVAVWGNQGRIVEMSEDALKLWDDFFHTTLIPTKQEAESAGTSMLNRVDLTLKKLILLFCINERVDVVTESVVERVLKLFPYLTGSYQVVGSEISKTAENTLATTVVDKIKEYQRDVNKLGPTASELQRTMHRDFKSVKEIRQLLDDLQELRMITATEWRTGKPGRPPVRFTTSD